MGEVFTTVFLDATRQLHEEDVTLLSVNHTLSDLTNSCVGGCVLGGGGVMCFSNSNLITLPIPLLHGMLVSPNFMDIHGFFVHAFWYKGGHMILS
jgi:hypothetical protein